MASIRTVSWTFEIDPCMMHTSSYINRRMIGGCCDSALFKVETSAPLGDSLIHTQTWQFIMTCWDGFGNDLLEKLVWIIQDHVIFMHVCQVCDYFVIQPRSFPPVGRVFTDSPWSRALHGRDAGLGFFGDGRGAGTAPHAPEKGLLGRFWRNSQSIFY